MWMQNNVFETEPQHSNASGNQNSLRVEDAVFRTKERTRHASALNVDFDASRSMNTAIAWILGIATLLGGIAAIGYIRDRWREKQQWTEKEKVVNTNWWESSELKEKYEAKGCKDFRWSYPDRLAERITDGMEVVFETDEENRIKYRLVNKSGQVLVCRKDA